MQSTHTQCNSVFCSHWYISQIFAVEGYLLYYGTNWRRTCLGFPSLFIVVHGFVMTNFVDKSCVIVVYFATNCTPIVIVIKSSYKDLNASYCIDKAITRKKTIMVVLQLQVSLFIFFFFFIGFDCCSCHYVLYMNSPTKWNFLILPDLFVKENWNLFRSTHTFIEGILFFEKKKDRKISNAYKNKVTWTSFPLQRIFLKGKLNLTDENSRTLYWLLATSLAELNSWQRCVPTCAFCMATGSCVCNICVHCPVCLLIFLLDVCMFHFLYPCLVF